MSFRFLLTGALLFLASCAYTLDKSIQDVSIVTPGAEDAVCYMYVEGLRYRVHPPQTVNISKSREDLVVDCLAPGNRRHKVVIEPTLEESTFLNVANGIVPGTSWDYASSAMFQYPAIVTVDFTGAQTTPELLPAHNNPDIRQPEDYDLEEFQSGEPRLNADRHRQSAEIARRRTAPGESLNGLYTENPVSAPPPLEAPPPDKGDLQDVLDKAAVPAYGPSAPSFPGQ